MQISILSHQTITAYPTRAATEAIVADLLEDADGETYEVREVAHGFAIMVVEDGEDLGYL